MKKQYRILARPGYADPTLQFYDLQYSYPWLPFWIRLESSLDLKRIRERLEYFKDMFDNNKCPRRQVIHRE